MTLIDTKGFGDNIDNEYWRVPLLLRFMSTAKSGTHPNVDPLDSFQEILSYLELQYDHILAEESRIRRNPRFKDQRVHALLYFIPPTGHSYVSGSYVWTGPSAESSHPTSQPPGNGHRTNEKARAQGQRDPGHWEIRHLDSQRVARIQEEGESGVVWRISRSVSGSDKK